MFHDREQELERLSEELLEEYEELEDDPEDEDWDEDYDDEDWDEDYDEEEIFDAEPVTHVRAYNTDPSDTDLNELSDEVYYASGSRLTGWMIAIGIFTIAALSALVYMLLRHYGIV